MKKALDFFLLSNHFFFFFFFFLLLQLSLHSITSHTWGGVIVTQSNYEGLQAFKNDLITLKKIDLIDPNGGSSYRVGTTVVLELVRIDGQESNMLKASALNEAVTGSVKSVFKAWENRLDTSGGHLESNEGDPELLVFIPFTSDVKIKSISVVGGADGTSPAKMRAFINRDGIDFSDAQSMQPVQEWDLIENLQGVLENQTRYSRFQSVGNLTLHFPDSFGAETTKIHYIGLKGEATQLKRDVVATIVYEIRPNPSDHKEVHCKFNPFKLKRLEGWLECC